MKKDIIYVLVQFGLFVLYFFSWELYTIDLPIWLVYIGLAGLIVAALVVILGIVNLNDNLSPFPSPKQDAVLIQNGIYKYIRHPIYSGLLLGMFGYALYSSSAEKLLITLVMGLVFYLKSNYEEQLLVTKYGLYKKYKKTTGRFFPKIFK